MKILVDTEQTSADGKFRLFGWRVRRAAGELVQYTGLYSRDTYGALVLVVVPGDRAASMKPVISKILKSFRFDDEKVKSVALASGAPRDFGSFSVTAPGGWVIRESHTGVVVVRRSTDRKLVVVQVNRLDGSAPFDEFMAKQLAQAPDMKPMGDVEVGPHKLATYTSTTRVEGRTMRVLWTLAGTPGRYHDVSYASEPDVFNAHLPTARAILKSVDIR